MFNCRNHARAPQTLFLTIVVTAGCYRSISIEERFDSELVDTEPSSAADTTVENEGTAPEIETKEANTNLTWPPMECVYRFRVTEKAYAGFSEVVDDVDDYFIIFNPGLEYVVVYGPNPFDDNHQLHSAKSPRQGNGTRRFEYILREFHFGGSLRVWREEEGPIRAELDFFGSGVPVMLSYGGYILPFDCGPPLVK